MYFRQTIARKLIGTLIAVGIAGVPFAFAYADVSLSIQSLSPSTNITVGTPLTFSVAASGFGAATYAVSDSFGGSSSITSSNIDSSGNFSWTPTSSDVGVHNITITVSDSQGDNATVQEQVTVASPASVSIQSLSPGSSVTVGTPVSFSVNVSGFTNPTYYISDSLGQVSSSDINADGDFIWTPATGQTGTHDLTVTVVDSYGHNVTASEDITVTGGATLTIQSVSPSTSVDVGQTLTFTAAASGFSSPTFSVSDSVPGSSISSADINSSGNFSWTPSSGDMGEHTITVAASDSSGDTANTSVTVSVNSGASVALTSPSPSASVSVGQNVTLNAYAYGFTSPTFSLSDSLAGTSLSDANVSSGAFNWIPTSADVGVHTITITATDASGTTANAQTTITVVGANGSTTSLAALESELEALETQVTAAGGTTSIGSGYVFTSYLYPGLTSSEVSQLQTTLEQQGLFSGSATGYYGAQTEAAVKRFQSIHGIDQLGVVGPSTRAALNALSSGSTASSTSTSASTGDGYVFNSFIGMGSTGTDVTELQTRLTALGDYSGPITGYFGSETQAAVVKFQAAHGIEQAGYVGPATRAALNG